MDRKQYWQQQTLKNNSFYLIICASVVGIESVMIAIYMLSKRSDTPNLQHGYLVFYLTAIVLSAVFAILFFLCRRQQKPLYVLHLAYQVLLLLWACDFAVYDVAQGNSSYVLAHVLIFTSAGPVIHSVLHCSMNGAAFLYFAFGVLRVPILEKDMLSELINLFILTVLSFVIVIYTNRLHYHDYNMNKTIQQQNEKLIFYARYDDLTRIYNRRMICEYLQEAVLHGGNICCVMLDVDDFKQYNDSFGHLEGDALLKELVLILQEYTNAHGGKVGRYGGEEFLLVFTGIEQSILQTAMQDMLLSISMRRMKKAVTASAGGCMWKQGMQVHELISKADDALYRVKCSGKNRFEFYE